MNRYEVEVIVVLGCEADAGRTQQSLEGAVGFDASVRRPLEWVRVKCLRRDPVVLRTLKGLEAQGLVTQRAGRWVTSPAGRTVGRRIHQQSMDRLSSW